MVFLGDFLVEYWMVDEPVHVVEHDFLCQSEDCQLQEDPVEVGSSQRRGSPHNLNRG